MLDIWISKAERHWKTFQPTRYKELKANGTLAKELRAAAELTDKEMRQLQEAGLRQDEAWMQTREKYLFPPEEPELTAQDEEQMDSSFHQAIVLINQYMRDELNRDDD